MAKKRIPLTGREIVNIGAEIDKVAKGSDELSSKIQKILSSGQSMSRGLRKQFRVVHQQLIKDTRQKQKELDKLLKLQAKGDKADSNRIRSLQRTISSEKGRIDVLDRVNDGQKALTSTMIAAKAATIIYGAALTILNKILEAMTKSWGVWLEIERRTTTAMGALAQNTGATREQFQQLDQVASSIEKTFEDLIGPMEAIGASREFVSELASSFRQVNQVTPELARNILQVSRGFGTGTEGAVSLYRTLQGLGEVSNPADFQDFAGSMVSFADSIGASAGVINRDFIEARANIAQFGRQGVQTFTDAATMANYFGFETKKIFDMVKGFDQFTQASNNVNQLNAILGTTLSSFELMQEQDPSRRLEMIRGELRSQGIEWANMSRPAHMALAQMMNLTEDEAARVFGMGESLEDLQRAQQEAAEQERRDVNLRRRNQEIMNDILERTQTRFDDISKAVERLWKVIAKALQPLFGDINESLVGVINSFSDWIEQVGETEEFKDLLEEVKGLFHDIFDLITSGAPNQEAALTKAREMISSVRTFISDIKDFFTWLDDHPIIERIITGPLSLAINAANLFTETLERISALIDSIANEGGGSISGVAGALWRRISGSEEPPPSNVQGTRGMLGAQRVEEAAAEEIADRVAPRSPARRQRAREVVESGRLAEGSRRTRGVVLPTSQADIEPESAVANAPEVEITAAAPVHASNVQIAGNQQPITIEAADIILNGRSIGQAFFEIAQRT